MKQFDNTFKKILEDNTVSSAFGAPAAGFPPGMIPANNDKAYAPGDARIPSFLGAKRRRGKKRTPIIQRRTF